MGRATDLLRSLTGQLNSRRACARLIQAEESRRGSRFDWVVMARPDLMWYAGIAPFCLWDANATVRKKDWVLVAPRNHADEWLNELPRQFFGCDASLRDWYAADTHMPERVLEVGLTAVTGSNQFVERSESNRTQRVRYGDEVDLLNVMRLPAALTRTADGDQPHSECVDSMPGVEEHRCLQATDYNPCAAGVSEE